MISNRKENTVDWTLRTDKIRDLVSMGHVSEEISLSDHRYIVCQMGNLEVTRVTYCKSRGPTKSCVLGKVCIAGC